MITYCIDLVTKDGQLVRIECPRKFIDKLHDSLEHAMKCRDWWSPAQFDGCSATYLGLLLTRVNMAEIVGTL